ncbi:hypothetical protein [Haliangium sp.]|uniref:hypothetical protein n=1 Tax=Haliangium sp. TaxID=2663208 RepID=UPI003D127E2B
MTHRYPLVLGGLLVGLAGAGEASADRVRYTPRPYSQQRAEQHIVHVEGMSGTFAVFDGEGGEGDGDLALVSGARVRFTQGYSELWAVEAVALAGHGRMFCLARGRPSSVCEQALRQMDLVRLAFGGVFRFGDKRIPHVRGNVGVQWTGHAMSERADGVAVQAESTEHEFSVIPTLGAGYDRRLGQNVIVGATLSLSWIAASTLRARGFHSVDAGLRVGVGW